LKSIIFSTTIACFLTSFPALVSGQPLPETKDLTLEGDLSSQLVSGVDVFLLRQLEESITQREMHWDRDFSSAQAYTHSVEKNRQRLAHLAGVRDLRIDFEDLEVIGFTSRSALVGKNHAFKALRVRWPTIRELHAEGLLLVPSRPNGINIVAIPDADHTPEMITGLAPGITAASQYARRLAESGCQVLIPTILSRKLEQRNGRATLTHREYIYRSAYELGRHLIGYEIQAILAAVDWFEKQADEKTDSIGVMGWGEGGLLALYSAAIDSRIDVACVSGYFDSRQNIWQEPVSRNIFGLLEQFGDAEIATLVTPRTLIIEAARSPEVELPGKGGAPARLITPSLKTVQQEVRRAHKLLQQDPELTTIELIVSDDGTGSFSTSKTLKQFLQSFENGQELAPLGDDPELISANDTAIREARLLNHYNDHNQWLLRESPFVRKEFMSKLDTSSVEKYEQSVEWYRDYFREEVVGHFDQHLLGANPRSRKIAQSELWDRYEVVLDVFPDVIAYGILTLPRGIKPGEKRPVVVCQHGLEGRPQSTIGEEQIAYYSAFATRLAERGFITFAPQNLYIFTDRFRTLQRKSYVLKKTLFSTIVPQHQQIVNWLKTLPQVDDQRIAFYGLSYGGKSAMRIPPLVTDYCLSICSADFNEWVRKNASTRHDFSYIWTAEYEIFEWDLGSTFNYAEMAYLICPRPFMVERGHFDGVGVDEWVAYEYAKVRHLYQALLHIGDQTEIEWFVGPHTINGVGTYQFLHKHLNWPEPHNP